MRCSTSYKRSCSNWVTASASRARQKRILIGDTYGFVDLVFYHRILKCHVLIELKLAEFSQEHMGQLNTYVSWFKWAAAGFKDTELGV